MKINLIGLPGQQLSAAGELGDLLDIQLSDEGIPVSFESAVSGIGVSFDGEKAVVRYSKLHECFRALGLVVEGIRKQKPFEIAEIPAYQSLGMMIDCSRNAVPTADAYERMIRHLALMGYSTVQLYTEDTYEVKEYPYFGYLRGRYTGPELKSMDLYARKFGIELVPCIQTLAHLGMALKWQAFSDVLDCNDILLIDEEKTYELIDAMFRTMSENISSRNINIGMDEAHMMGLGKYLDKHGYHDRPALMLKHFSKVMEIARKYGYKPMMWSDMFFRLASAGEYYDINSPIKEEVIDMIPDDISLVYWDYYSVDSELYDGMLRKHKQLSDRIVFAGGAWKWMGFSPNNHFSRLIGKKAHSSCVRNGIEDVIITAWGDNGAEASLYSVLPTLQLWAELCYRGSAPTSFLAERFETCVGGNYDDFLNLDKTMLVPDHPPQTVHSINPPKYLLYQDVLYGLFDKHVEPATYAAHFWECADFFKRCAARNMEWRSLFETQYRLSRLLELKSGVGIGIREAYLARDTAALENYCDTVLPELRKRAEEFIEAYHRQWFEENKIFGLDAFDLRMGGLLQRVQTAISRIRGHLDGRFVRLEELEQEILYFDGRKEGDLANPISANLWHTIATPSVIAGI